MRGRGPFRPAPEPLARALIVGCGCRGRALGARLAAEAGRAGRLRTADGERRSRPQESRPLRRPGSARHLLELVGDVTVVHWLLGSAAARPEDRRDPRFPFGALLEKLVDTPVRGFVYEAAGTVQRALLEDASEWFARPPALAHSGRGGGGGAGRARRVDSDDDGFGSATAFAGPRSLDSGDRSGAGHPRIGRCAQARRSSKSLRIRAVAPQIRCPSTS